MRCLPSLPLLFICGVAVLGFSGCFPSPQSQSDEEKEPHFLEGKARVNTLDYEGAIECYEKSLQANPESAAAHFELACLFDQKENDPAAAIYHYTKYRQLRPNAPNVDMVKQRELACKQELARSVSLGPVTEKVQRDLDQLTQENKRLTDENKKLHEDLEKWVAYAGTLQGLTNRPAPAEKEPPAAGASTVVADRSNANLANIARSPTTSAKPSRSHTIQAGDTPISIARKYGLKLEALMAANPRVDARHLQVGRSLVIPAP